MVVVDLAAVARRSDEAVRDARAELVRAVREASREGLTQAQIAQLIGRSQPEVSRLLRFHGRGPLAQRLRRHAREVRELVERAGGSNVRVFGSVATGTEHDESDIDLLFDMGTPIGLMELGKLERRLSELLDADVDLIPAAALRPDLRDRVLAEAVAL
jgi:predicted nucleotidyltransferase